MAVNLNNQALIKFSLQTQLRSHCFSSSLLNLTLIQIYNEEAKDPRLLRNMPPVSNKIMWAQQLCRKIAEPILEFDRLGVLKAPVSQKNIHFYKVCTDTCTNCGYLPVEFQCVGRLNLHVHRGPYYILPMLMMGLTKCVLGE